MALAYAVAKQIGRIDEPLKRGGKEGRAVDACVRHYCTHDDFIIFERHRGSFLLLVSREYRRSTFAIWQWKINVTTTDV